VLQIFGLLAKPVVGGNYGVGISTKLVLLAKQGIGASIWLLDQERRCSSKITTRDKLNPEMPFIMLNRVTDFSFNPKISPASGLRRSQKLCRTVIPREDSGFARSLRHKNLRLLAKPAVEK
jgi:hypothetical protein